MFFLLHVYKSQWWFSEDFRRFFKAFPKARRTFRNIFREFPKMSEDFLRLPKTFEEDPKMFRWYTTYFKYNLRDKLDISEIIDIFTCEDIISWHARKSYRFYQFVTARYTTDFYIIKSHVFLSFTGTYWKIKWENHVLDEVEKKTIIT